jgi:hypothetical protein
MRGNCSAGTLGSQTAQEPVLFPPPRLPQHEMPPSRSGLRSYGGGYLPERWMLSTVRRVPEKALSILCSFAELKS